jgi:hypothetical protein
VAARFRALFGKIVIGRSASSSTSGDLEEVRGGVFCESPMPAQRFFKMPAV